MRNRVNGCQKKKKKKRERLQLVLGLKAAGSKSLGERTAPEHYVLFSKKKYTLETERGLICDPPETNGPALGELRGVRTCRAAGN